MNKWPIAKLGEVIRHRKEFITINDLVSYKRPRVRTHAQGIILRDEIPGALIKTKTQQVCKTGEFLVAEIDAKVGGFGIVPAALNNSIVSSHYFLFVVDETKLERCFLDYFIRTPMFFEQVDAQGSTNYAAIRPAHVLGYEIPLPPLAEQRRIVARIEEFVTKIDEIHSIRAEEKYQIQQILTSVFCGIIQDAPRKLLSEVAPMIRRTAEISSDIAYPELGIRSFGKGTFHKPAISGFDLGTKRIFEIKSNDLLFSNVFAWEGAIAVAQEKDNGRFGSHRFISCVPKDNVAVASFLCYYFLSCDGIELIRAASPGSAGRNRTLGIEALQKIKVPVPPIGKQKWFSDLLTEFNGVQCLQTETTNELDALLPSVLVRAFKGEL